jgi:hypothetical protein
VAVIETARFRLASGADEPAFPAGNEPADELVAEPSLERSRSTLDGQRLQMGRDVVR